MKKILVKIVIPIYRENLGPKESASLKQIVSLLSDYPLILLKPQGLDVSKISSDFPELESIEVSDEWLGAKNGIQGYNRMMLSQDFYKLFSDSEYILICHTDSWIFTDELSQWCQRGYDCVAAPWIRRSFYDLPIIKQYMSLRCWIANKSGKPTRQFMYGKVGNGGLSLRKVSSFRQACVDYASTIEVFNTSTQHLFNEDVFWATVPENFSYPCESEALRFAIDTNPSYCYNKLCNKQLPFGCHGWTKPRMYKFWRKFIAH